MSQSSSRTDAKKMIVSESSLFPWLVMQMRVFHSWLYLPLGLHRFTSRQAFAGM
jgi:hypothetical protein